MSEMSEALFNVVFKGKFVSQLTQERAVLHFSKLYKIPTSKAQRFFDGKPRVLKKSLSLDKASHFRKALKKAGLRVSLVKQQSEVSAKVEASLSLSEVGVVIVNKPFSQPKHFDTSELSLDNSDDKIVPSVAFEKTEFDLSEIELDEVGSQFDFKKKVQHLDVDISNISMENVGAIFAKKQIIEQPEIDISEMDLDEVGSILAIKKKTPTPDINTDNIELSE